MKNFWSYIALLVFFFLPQDAYPSMAQFKLLNTNDGLFNNQVRFLTQLEDGRILAYTEGMFNIYDGHRFEPLACDLNHTLPLGMHNVCTAYDGGDGLLWAKDYYRLYLIDTRTQRFRLDLKERFQASRLKEPLNDFILDKDKKAWLITANGALYRYDWQHPASMIYQPTTEEKKAGIKATDVIQAGAFHLIFLNTGKMLCWEEKSGRIIGEDLTTATNYPAETFRTAWLQTDEQHLLVSVSHTEGYVYLYNIYTRQWKTILKGEAINDIKKDQSGCFWLGGNNVLIKLSRDYEVVEKLDKFGIANDGSQVQDFIMSILIDKDQGLWLGTGSTGILKKLSSNHYVEYYANTATSDEDGKIIRCLAPYDQKQLLIGTFRGFFLFDTKQKTYRPFLHDLSDCYCYNIQKDTQGRFWLCTRQGLFCLQEDHATRKDEEITKNPSFKTVRFCLPLADGKMLACFNLKDLYLYDPQKGQSIRLASEHPALARSRVMSFATEFAPGKLLIGGQGGLFEYDTAHNTMKSVPWMAPWEKYSTKYNCAYAENGIIWIGTQNGLIRHDSRKGETIRFGTAEGLPNNCIQGITADQGGNLWVSTSNGIAKIIPYEKEGKYSIAKLCSQDGVQPGEMMEQSITSMPNGHIYAGGMNGITDIPTESTDYSSAHLVPTLMGLRIMNQTINNEGMFRGRLLFPEGFSYTRDLRLHYDENFLEFRFSALDYDTPQHTRYRYRLEGLDKTWHYTATSDGICRATYTSLTPGEYTLEVQAAMGNAPWGEASEWTITILPPWWKTWWAYTLYIIAALLALYYVIELYFAYKRSLLKAEQENLERQKEQQLDELKFRFFTNISHEFRTPLALIITPLELLIHNTKDELLKKDLGKILGNAKDLLKLVNQLLDFRRLEQKGERLKLSTVHPLSFIKGCVEPFMEIANGKNIGLSCECRFDEEDTFNLDREKIVRVMNNLLSNALKFTPEGGFISVDAEWQEAAPGAKHPAGIRIRVSDTGCGIKEEDQAHIFDRFFQSENKQSQHLNTGSGIGLHLTKGYVDLHNGQISVESAQGKGTTFCITLPWHDLPATAPEEDAKENGEKMPDSNLTPASEENGKHTTILIVEDNAQFRTFMQDLLSRDYHILTAENGKKGLEMAREHNPDLIISDVMMPVMDGHEFCRKIKHDMKCSHIPFILLTAKNSSESRSGAYDAGADSFIAKPFDIDVLASRIRQLLEQERKRRKRFSEELQVEPKDIAITPIDEQLLERAVKCVEKNMGNTEYTVDQLSADVGIERSVLWRKLQALVGQSPSEFIRSLRLKRAAELLATGRYSVQDISWKVGFNTPRYFSSYFKEMFGVTPSQYAKKDKPSAQ